jgi:hypothetical protein
MTTYLPSAFYVAALRNLADADLGWGVTIVALFVCASLVLLMVELPILLRLLAPHRTGQILAAYNGWMNRHGWDVVLLLAAASSRFSPATDGSLPGSAEGPETRCGCRRPVPHPDR